MPKLTPKAEVQVLLEQAASAGAPPTRTKSVEEEEHEKAEQAWRSKTSVLWENAELEVPAATLAKKRSTPKKGRAQSVPSKGPPRTGADLAPVGLPSPARALKGEWAPWGPASSPIRGVLKRPASESSQPAPASSGAAPHVSKTSSIPAAAGLRDEVHCGRIGQDIGRAGSQQQKSAVSVDPDATAMFASESAGGAAPTPTSAALDTPMGAQARHLAKELQMALQTQVRRTALAYYARVQPLNRADFRRAGEFKPPAGRWPDGALAVVSDERRSDRDNSCAATGSCCVVGQVGACVGRSPGQRGLQRCAGDWRSQCWRRT